MQCFSGDHESTTRARFMFFRASGRRELDLFRVKFTLYSLYTHFIEIHKNRIFYVFILMSSHISGSTLL